MDNASAPNSSRIAAPSRCRCYPLHRPRGSLALAAALAAAFWSSAAAAQEPSPPPASAALPPASPGGAPAAPAALAPSGRAGEAGPRPRRDNAAIQRSLGVITGAVGIGGVVVGGVFGLLALSQWNSVQAQVGSCADPAHYSGCPQELKNQQNTASSYATVSTFGLTTGLAALAGGIVIWYTAPRAPRPAARSQLVPMVSHGSAGLVVTGVF